MTVPVPDPEDVPEELRERDQWLMWDTSEEKPRAPLNEYGYKASWTDPDEWMNFERVCEIAAEIDTRGIGYVFANTNDDHPRGIYGGLDLDGCADEDGHPKEWLPSLTPFSDHDAYIEWSPSGTGLHIPLAGFEPPEWWSDQHFTDGEHEGVEAYGKKFFTVTGNQLNETGDDVVDAGEWVNEWLAEAYESITGEDPRNPTPEGGSSDSKGGVSTREATDREEWFDAEAAKEALDHIDPDLPNGEWIRVGFGLANHFPGGTAERLFEDWSRGGSKWDGEAERRVSSIIGDANGDVGIGTVIYQAEQGGWDASAAAREATAATDGGVTAKSPDQGDSPGTDTTADSSKALGWIDAQEYFRSNENGSTGEGCQIAARQLLDEFDLLTVEENDDIWRYDPETGIYEDDAEARLRKRLADGLASSYTRSRVSDILHRVRSETYVKRDALTAPKDRVCVANGVLDLSDPSDPTLLDHSPERHFTWRLNAAYDPDAEATEFKNFLQEVVRADDLPKLQQFAGSTLRHWKQPRNLLAILGPTDAGKGVFLRVLKAVFGGSGNVASESLYSLAETRWGTAQLHRTPINITNELSTGTLKNPDQVKKLAGEGDQISAENKGEDPFQFVPTTSHIFATNQVPKVEHGDDAFYNRWLFVTFPTTVPPNQRDETLTDRIVQDAEERSGVLNWLLEGYAEYREQTGYTGERSIGEKEDMWSAYGDSVDRFIDKCVDDDAPDEKIPKADAYEAYKEMCDDVGLPAEAQQTLTRRLKKLSGVSDGQFRSADAITTDSDRPYCYTGVTWTDDGRKFLDFVQREHLRNDDSEDEDRDGFNDSLGGY